MERYNGTIPPTYFRSAKVVLFVYAVDNPESIDDIESWADSVRPGRLQYAGHTGDIMRVLVANKIDLASGGSEDVVSTDRGKNTAESLDADLFFEISALHGTGFDDFFAALVREIRKKAPDSEKEEQLQNTVSLAARNNHHGGSKSGCC